MPNNSKELVQSFNIYNLLSHAELQAQRGREIDNKGKTPRMYKIERISAFLLRTWKSSLWSDLSWLVWDKLLCPRQNLSDKDVFVFFLFILKSKAQYTAVLMRTLPDLHTSEGWDGGKYLFQREGRSVTNSIVIINLYNEQPLKWLYKHTEERSKQRRQIKPENSSTGRSDPACSTSYRRIMAPSLTGLSDQRASLPQRWSAPTRWRSWH